jgi:hypothetical protein
MKLIIRDSRKAKRIVDTSLKEECIIDPEEVARRLGGEIVEPKGKMLDWIRQSLIWLPPALRSKWGKPNPH